MMLGRPRRHLTVIASCVASLGLGRAARGVGDVEGCRVVRVFDLARNCEVITAGSRFRCTHHVPSNHPPGCVGWSFSNTICQAPVGCTISSPVYNGGIASLSAST
jgi:hypothetical protein